MCSTLTHTKRTAPCAHCCSVGTVWTPMLTRCDGWCVRVAVGSIHMDTRTSKNIEMYTNDTKGKGRTWYHIYASKYIYLRTPALFQGFTLSFQYLFCSIFFLNAPACRVGMNCPIHRNWPYRSVSTQVRHTLYFCCVCAPFPLSPRAEGCHQICIYLQYYIIL